MKTYPLEAILEAHRQETHLTCPEDCWCWDIDAYLMWQEQQQDKEGA